VGTGPAEMNYKDYDEVERFFKNPTYEGTSSTINTTTSAAAVMYDTVGQPSSKQTVNLMTYTAASSNGHMYEALDKQDTNGISYRVINKLTHYA
jgi:hypothetical protein